jgi:hypothetical protein
LFKLSVRIPSSLARAEPLLFREVLRRRHGEPICRDFSAIDASNKAIAVGMEVLFCINSDNRRC